MAEITLKALKDALAAGGLNLTEEQDVLLLQVWRKLENPDGCPVCGQHVLVGVPKGRRGLRSACCDSKIG